MIQTLLDIDGALRRCKDCIHEVTSFYKIDQQGNTIRLPDNYRPLKSETGGCPEPVITGNSCDVINGNYRAKFNGSSFIECPFFKKRKRK